MSDIIPAFDALGVTGNKASADGKDYSKIDNKAWYEIKRYGINMPSKTDLENNTYNVEDYPHLTGIKGTDINSESVRPIATDIFDSTVIVEGVAGNHSFRKIKLVSEKETGRDVSVMTEDKEEKGVCLGDTLEVELENKDIVSGVILEIFPMKPHDWSVKVDILEVACAEENHEKIKAEHTEITS